MSLKKIILGIGANIGDDKTKIKNIQTAINYISQKKKIFFLKKASIYLTDPVNMSTNNWFFNTIISVKSSLSPKDLLIFLQNIEKNMGRLEKFQKKNTDNSKKRRYDDRIIDIDIIDYKGQIINI
ncbi:MAG: 2-amino-4-hydroxy-6-hydroxymethyldihydropteridine diphosphokinase, partial [Elusimicrobiota bacterium]|nr:2-amino-4-hydroxy-6-hydroxymethyldihydropteridine diphosphokinase [Elusimicrobiota bacterium]